ncbi:MAG: hypothetical protein WA885_15290 [Phormidesmis sp.]
MPCQYADDFPSSSVPYFDLVFGIGADNQGITIFGPVAGNCPNLPIVIERLGERKLLVERCLDRQGNRAIFGSINYTLPVVLFDSRLRLDGCIFFVIGAAECG